MDWKQILKIDMDEARELGDKYAPKDMEQGRKDIADRKEKIKQLTAEESLPKRRKQLQLAIDWMQDNVETNFVSSDAGSAVKFSIEKAKEHLMEPEVFNRYILAIKSLLRTAPDGGPYVRGGPPRQTPKKENKFKGAYSPRHFTTEGLMDRAKQANKDDPRMGSGRR
tara:strand:+ start:265 stop:765 length:501 start_codon:yes stop_codon:yes gene_type:complete